MVFFLIFFSIAMILIISFAWNLIKTIISTIFWTVVQIWKHFKVDVPMEKNGFLAKKQLEQKMIEAEEQQKYKNQILYQQNKIISAGLNKVRELRTKYTYADERLFQMLLRKYPVLSVAEINTIEEEIKASHINNELIYGIDTTPKRTYTLADINGLEALEEDREDPLIMRIYKIERDYLLFIKDIDNNTCQLLQSMDYLIIAKVRKKILDVQRTLKKSKQKIQSQEIADIFNDTNYNVSLYRRNRLKFLDN